MYWQSNALNYLGITSQRSSLSIILVLHDLGSFIVISLHAHNEPLTNAAPGTLHSSTCVSDKSSVCWKHVFGKDVEIPECCNSCLYKYKGDKHRQVVYGLSLTAAPGFPQSSLWESPCFFAFLSCG